MTSTRIEWSHQKIAKLADGTDLAEMLFPGNRNQQHAFVLVWAALKWSPHHMVPNLGKVTQEHGVSRRTLERIRAKLRRLGLLDHVSRFNRRFSGREGWVLSSRFEQSLRAMADKVASLKDIQRGDQEKEEILIQFAAMRRRAAGPDHLASSRTTHGGDDS